MHTVADWDDINDLHGAHVRFGGDIFLKPRSKRTAEAVAYYTKGDRDGQEQDPPESRLCSSKREPGQSPGKKRGGGHVRPTASVNG